MPSGIRQRLHQVLFYALVVAFLFCLALPFVPERSDEAILMLKLASNGFVIGIFLLLAWCCMLPMDKPGLRVFPIVGVTVCLLSMLYIIVLTWWADEGYGGLGGFGYLGLLRYSKLFTLIGLFSVSFAHASLLLRLNVHTDAVRRIRFGTLAAIALVTAIILLMVLAESVIGEWLGRAVLFAYIIAFFGTIMTLYLHEIARSEISYLQEEDFIAKADFPEEGTPPPDADY